MVDEIYIPLTLREKVLVVGLIAASNILLGAMLCAAIAK